MPMNGMPIGKQGRWNATSVAGIVHMLHGIMIVKKMCVVLYSYVHHKYRQPFGKFPTVKRVFLKFIFLYA